MSIKHILYTSNVNYWYVLIYLKHNEKRDFYFSNYKHKAQVVKTN